MTGDQSLINCLYKEGVSGGKLALFFLTLFYNF